MGREKMIGVRLLALVVGMLWLPSAFAQAKKDAQTKLAQVEDPPPNGELDLPPEEPLPEGEEIYEDDFRGPPPEGQPYDEPPLNEPPLNEPPLEDPMRDPQLQDPPLQDPPMQDPPEVEELPEEQPRDEPEPIDEPQDMQPPPDDDPIDRSPPENDRRLPPTGTPAPESKPGGGEPVQVNVTPAEEQKPGDDRVGADLIPDGQELVNIDFPEPTDIKDIIRAVSLWTGKNVILGRDVSGKVQMISPRKVTKVEAYQAFLSALNLLGLTTVETGKVIKIVPVRSAVKSNLKTFLGASWTPMTDELITQIVPLKYIDAKDIQTTLSRIVSSNSMIAYQPTNTLIISDSGYKVRRILDIIALLDVQTQQPQLSIVPIKNGDAKVISAMVQDIFRTQSSGKKSRTSSDYLTYKILVDERTNSVVIFGPPRTIADVKELVRKFDVKMEDPSQQSSIHVRPLDYADAKKLATTLSSLASGGSSRSTRRPPIRRTTRRRTSRTTADSPPPVAQLDDDVKITADESSNSLLVTGSRAAYDALNSIIRKLDIRRSQVFVEAEILDINVTNGFRFGSSVFAGAGSEEGTKTAVTWEASQIAPLIVSQASGTTDRTGIAQAAQPFQNDLTIGILSGAKVNVPGIGEISPGALIKMIKTDASSRVLSSPHILTSNNEEAKITVGEKLYYRTAEVSTSGTAVENVKHEDVDLSLEIKPNISHSNYVTLKIDLNANTGTIDSESRLPSVNKRQTSQIVTVKNGQTVVISGLVKTTELEVYQKIPLLGDIPILGWLFRNTDTKKQKSNLMIFLTPHVIHGANDLAAIYQRKVEERDEILEKVYGSSFTDDEFYKLLPQKEDGIYQADAFDVIDREKRDQRHQEMMKDMGYEPKEIEEINRQLERNEEKTKEKVNMSGEPEEEAATKRATIDTAQTKRKG